MSRVGEQMGSVMATYEFFGRDEIEKSILLGYFQKEGRI